MPETIDYEKIPPVTLTGTDLVRLWEHGILTTEEVRLMLGLAAQRS